MPMSPQTSSYHYDEIPHNAFRYIVLYPGIDSDDLECSLHTSLVDEARYESVSYVWGTNHRDRDIVCDGKILKITPNLYDVLKRVRLQDATRNLWVDSICINQEDFQEKGHQVAIMGRIYRAAQRVIICIGSAKEEHGSNVRSLLKDVCEMIDIGYAEIKEAVKELKQREELNYEWIPWDFFPHPDANAPVLSDPRWASLNVLVEQDWFKRGWVVREAGLAREALVVWGQTEFLWDELMRALVWRHRRAVRTIDIPAEDCFRPHLEAYEARHQDTICVFYQEGSWKACSLLDYIHFARILQLTNPRDRIYAFLDLAEQPLHSLNVVPNYNDTPVKVYRDFATHYVCTTSDVSILHYVTHDEESLKSATMTWAPEWDKIINSSTSFVSLDDNHPPLLSRNLQSSKPELTDDVTLKVKGVVIDSVQHVSKVLQASTTTPEDLFEIWQLFRAVTSTCYPTSHLLEAFFDTLAMASFYGDHSQWYQYRGAYIALFKRLALRTDHSIMITWDTDEVAELKSSIFHGMIASMTSGKRIVVTERGYLGFAPAVAEVRDLCGIIFGCISPCLLRKTTSENCYIYLGPSFILGKNSIDYADTGDDRVTFNHCLGVEDSKEWEEWDVEEQDIYLC